MGKKLRPTKRHIDLLLDAIEEIRFDVSETHGEELTDLTIIPRTKEAIKLLKKQKLEDTEEKRINKLLGIIRSKKFLQDPESCLDEDILDIKTFLEKLKKTLK
tara:strand:- start:211 stop:519 length:309 start_codon:yes stop_codon:yes gene_type:complete